MDIKNVMIYIFAILFIVLLVVLYARQFERSNIFFPMRQMEGTPSDMGLAYEDVYFETSDGVKLNGWFIPAEGARGTVLYFHGNAGNISHRVGMIRIFNKMGLNIFIIDYRGYGRSEGRPDEKGTYLDAEAAYAYLKSRGDVDEERIALYGKSLGGAVAIDLASKRDVPALVSDSAFTSTADIGKEIYPFLPMDMLVTMKYDNISKIGSVRAPKLIIHSSQDEIIPFRHGERLFEAASGPKEFYRMRGTHNDGFLVYEEEFSSRMSDFLKRHGM